MRPRRLGWELRVSSETKKKRDITKKAGHSGYRQLLRCWFQVSLRLVRMTGARKLPRTEDLRGYSPAGSQAKARVVLRDPGFDRLLELPDLLEVEDFRSLGVAHDIRRVVIEQVLLPPAGLEVGDQTGDARTHVKLRGLEANLVMTLFRNDSIARTRNGHLGRLESGIVRRCEGAIGRETGQPGVVKVPIDQGPQVIEFLLACRVRPDAVGSQELLPGHPRLPQ